MRPQSPFPDGTVERMKQLLALTDSLDHYRRIQSIYLRAKYGFSALEIADLVGLKAQTIRNLQAAYLNEGESALQLRRKGGRHRFNLSAAEEDRLLAAFAQDGQLGKIVQVRPLQQAYEQRVGHVLPDSTVYRLLHRHGWRKLAPRGRHPKGQGGRIEGFKKTFPSS